MSLLLRRGVISSGKGGAFAVNSANFDGSTQYWISSSAFTIGVNYSYACWVKPSGTGTTRTLMRISGTGPPADIQMTMHTDDTVFMAHRNSSVGISVGLGITALSDGTWYHVAVTYDGTDGRIYIDGVLDSTTAMIGTSLDTGFMRNVLFSGVEHFNGSQYGCLYSTGVLSQTDITELANNASTAKCYASLSSGLVSSISNYWDLGNFNGITGSELTDNKGSNGITLSGSPTFTGTGLSVEC